MDFNTWNGMIGIWWPKVKEIIQDNVFDLVFGFLFEYWLIKQKRGRSSGDGWLLEAVANREGLSRFCCLDRIDD